ncbi:hypothetical protein Tco_0739115 [Tanacetum coccineum]|uniref:Uncharacterized protein n=1 Tax=Tanacetum coccineum TaxID=301880 RepID=A0ABQ4ZBF8_9ASTR
MILMASLDHRKNPLNLELKNDRLVSFDTAYFCCFKGGLEDKILVPKPPQNCATCGDPVDGLYCRPCAFVRKCLNEGWYIIHDGNTSESSNDNTNITFHPLKEVLESIPFGVMPKVLSIAWKRFGEIKDDLTDKKYQQEDIHESMNKLLEDV